MNQLFYSPDTRLKIEQELKKLADESNPFQNGHISKWGQVKDKLETIGEMIKRWNETLADSKLVKDLYDDFKRKYFEKIEKGSNKESLISKQIRSSIKFRLNDDELPKKSFDGFRNKGYRWYEEGENFSLKDFVLYHPETISDNVFEEVQLVIAYEVGTPDLIQTLVKWAPKNELYFCDACEGYAAAKYVAFLKSELEEIPISKSRSKKRKPEFKPKLFKELFLNPDLISDCLALLRNTTKPCINDADEFLRDKGVFVIWFYALEYKKIFNYTFANDDERADTLNLNFPKLNISGSLFRSPNAKAKSSYKNHFENEIAAIKS